MYSTFAFFGAEAEPDSTEKPVICKIPSPVSMGADGVAVENPLKSATVKVVPPTVTSLIPSGAVTTMEPLVVSVTSATEVNPASYTVACPVAAPFSSVGLIPKVPVSVTPLMVMVS